MKLIYFLLFLFTLIISPASSSSLLSETQLLIKFKNSLPNPNVLKNWSPLYHTCSFFGVSCSSLADVIAIDLTGIPISATFSAVTASLLHLPNLRTLVLTSTNLTGDFKIRANSSCGPHLRDVDVSDNAIAGTPSDVALFSRTCSSLKTFNLSNNLIAGRFAAGANLETLDLSYNRISTVANVIRIPFLKNLNLAGNVISGKIPSFSNCSELESFDISFNQVSDANLKALSSCTNLKALDLSSNSLTGELPVEELSALTALESVSLSNNSFSGKLRLEIFTSLAKLKSLQLSFNNFSGELPASLSSNLEQLGLSSNGLTGSIPGTLCGNSSLKELHLQGNLLTGRIPASLSNCSELHSLDLSFNYLTGTIPASLGGLSQLKDLIMWQNLLEGEIPNELGLVSSLEYLILDYNRLTSDELPSGLGNCSNLYWISLSSNRLSGGIPKWIGGLKNLAVLMLGNNSFSGEIPKEIGDCTSLLWLDLNSNSLSGSIPASLAAQSGKIAGGLFTRKRFALMVSDGGKDCHWSMNLLESDGIRLESLVTLLPSQGTCSFTRVYTGSILSIFNDDRSMIFLDLSYNQLEGEIPEEIGSMLSLLVLNLGHNLLAGLIPSELGNLTNVGTLDLSHNLLEGPIPSSFSGLSFLSELDLSYNKLNGTIPDSGRLATFPIYAYENNSGLCGYPLPICSKNLFPALSNNQPNMDSTDVHTSIIGLPFWIGLTTSFFGTILFFIVYWSD